MKTTLNKIRDCSPCKSGWEKLLNTLGKTKADNEELSLLTILDSNGIEDAIWCFRAVDGFDDEILAFARFCAMQNIEKIKPYTLEETYNLIINWLETGNKDIRSEAAAAAGAAARSAAEAAERSAAEAWAEAPAAAWAEAWSAARSAAAVESAARSPAAAEAVAAARSAARSAAWAAAEARSEAPAAAWSAARSAARSVQEVELRRILSECK